MKSSFRMGVGNRQLAQSAEERRESTAKQVLNSLPPRIQEQDRAEIARLIENGLGGYFEAHWSDEDTDYAFEIKPVALVEPGDTVMIKNLPGIDDPDEELPAIVLQVYNKDNFVTEVDCNVLVHGRKHRSLLATLRENEFGNTFENVPVMIRHSDHPMLDQPNLMIALVDRKGPNTRELFEMLQELAKEDESTHWAGVVAFRAVIQLLVPYLNEIRKHYNLPDITYDKLNKEHAAIMTGFVNAHIEFSTVVTQELIDAVTTPPVAHPQAPADPQTPATRTSTLHDPDPMRGGERRP